MELFVTHAVVGMVGLSIALSAAVYVQTGMLTLGNTLVITVVDAKAQPGAGEHLFTADRGSRKGQHVLVSAAPPKSPAVSGASTVYTLLSASTAGPLPHVDVLGMHYLKVRPERREAFEKFVADKLHPTVGNLRPDLRILYYKDAKGADANNYLALFALTKVSRDKYWPGGSDSDDLRAAFSPPVKALTTELASYLVEGSYATDPKLAAAVYESREWTDFVLVSK
jgi:hypothetical protein